MNITTAADTRARLWPLCLVLFAVVAAKAMAQTRQTQTVLPPGAVEGAVTRSGTGERQSLGGRACGERADPGVLKIHHPPILGRIVRTQARSPYRESAASCQ